MKFFSLVLLMIFCEVTSYAQEQTGCLQYHKGKFVYEDSVGNVVYIKRNKHYQTEYLTENNVWISFRIKWTSDCAFELYQVGSNSKEQRKNNHTSRKIVISKALENGYEYSCGCEDSSKITGVVKKATF